MERILVVGGPGSGKSYFSDLLAAKTGLPLIHLDQEFWLPGWQMPEADAWQRKLDILLAQPRWIMDGAYVSSLSRRLERADTVFVFKLPRSLCLYRTLKRSLTSYGTIRPDMAPGCPERLDWSFFKYTWRFNTRLLPRIEQELIPFQGDLHLFKSSQSANAYLCGLDKTTN